MSWEAVASIAGPVIGGLLGQGATSSANRTNLKIAGKQESFQREMSNTAHQREVEDLRAAGLNPLLSGGGSGASTPTGASTRVEANNELGKGLERSVSGAMDARRLRNEIQQSDATVGLTKASQATQVSQAEKNVSDALSARTVADRTAMQNQILKTQMPTIAKRAEADLKHAEYDTRWAAQDALLRRTSQATGAVGNLFGIGKFLKGFGKTDSPRPTGYKQENYSQQGEHMGTHERTYTYPSKGN